MATDIKQILNELKVLLLNIERKQINFQQNPLEQEFDFKRKEREYYARQLVSTITKIKEALPQKEIEKIKQAITQKKFQKAVLIVDSILKTIPDNKFRVEKEEFFLPRLPKEIYSEVKASFDELCKCYEHGCYRSALILCGRILEIALHHKYFELTNNDLLEKAPDIGLGNLVRKLKEKGLVFDPGIDNQIHLINQLRIASVHKKKQPFNPSAAQCKASILYTLDVLKKIF